MIHRRQTYYISNYRERRTAERERLGRDIVSYPFGKKMYLDVWLCLATGLQLILVRNHTTNILMPICLCP